MNKEGNQPAYPTQQFDFERMKNAHYGEKYNQYTETFGLTKREYFAALAMQGILSGPHQWSDPSGDYKHASQIAIRFADELLKQLSQ